MANQELTCATDETKLWLSPSVKQHQNPCSGPLPVYQDLSMHHDWPFNKGIVDLQIRIKGNSKLINQINKINTIWS